VSNRSLKQAKKALTTPPTASQEGQQEGIITTYAYIARAYQQSPIVAITTRAI
jgi:hypothetical protein